MNDKDKFSLEQVIASGMMAQLSEGEKVMVHHCVAEIMNSLMTVPERVAVVAFMQVNLDFLEQVKKGGKSNVANGPTR